MLLNNLKNIDCLFYKNYNKKFNFLINQNK